MKNLNFTRIGQGVSRNCERDLQTRSPCCNGREIKNPDIFFALPYYQVRLFKNFETIGRGVLS